MKGKTLLMLAGASGLAYWLIRTKNAVENLQWGIAQVAFDKKNTTVLRIALKVVVRITNPTQTAVRFDSLNASLSLKGNQISTITASRATNPITIAPGTTDVAVMAWLDTFGILQSIPGIINAIKTGGLRDAILVRGTLRAGGIEIPLTQEVRLGTTPQVGKARVSLEFDTNDEAAEYFERSNIYVTPSPSQKRNRPGNPGSFSLNGVGSVKKKLLRRHG
jgi:hypothetical protein